MREALALKQIFPDSHVTFWQFVALLLSNIGRDMLAAVRQRKVIGGFFGILMFRVMQYWGTYRGMNYRSPLTHELITKFYYPRSLRPAHPPREPDAVAEKQL